VPELVEGAESLRDQRVGIACHARTRSGARTGELQPFAKVLSDAFRHGVLEPERIVEHTVSALRPSQRAISIGDAHGDAHAIARSTYHAVYRGTGVGGCAG